MSKKITTFAVANVNWVRRRRMIVLNIETSTDACSAAITRDGSVMHDAEGRPLCHLQRTGSEHAKDLPLMVEDLLSRLKKSGEQVEAVAVSEGPGSYTGLRIGASVAKGLAYGLNVPLMAVPTLEIMAREVKGEVKMLCPMIDARRMEVYDALYGPDLQEISPVVATVVDEHSFAAELAQGKVAFFGNGAAKCKSVIRHENAVFVDEIVPDAAYMQGGKVVDTAYWEPFYLKAYEAKKSTNIIK